MAESVQIVSISHRHEAIVDWLLANPGQRNLQALADFMGFSRSWLSIVMRSDVFREYYERRRQEFGADLSRRIVEKQMIVTSKALDKLETLLEREDTDPRLVLDTATKVAQQLGYGTQPKVKTTVTEERTQELTRPVDAGVLAQARETMRRTVKTELVTHETQGPG